MSERPAIVWFRNDLRVADNPAISAAAKSGRPVTALYVLEEEGPEIRPLGAASRWWLAQSLRALTGRLASLGLTLVLRRGRAEEIVPAMARATNASRVFWNDRYGKGAQVDLRIRAELHANGVAVETSAGSLLFEPGTLKTKTGSPMRVFTSFWRAARALDEPRSPLPAPKRLAGVHGIQGDAIDDWQLEPNKPDWAGGLRETWKPGEAAAAERLAFFVDHSLADYATKRDRPDLERTSRLSPHLRFGELSPVQIWHAIAAAKERGNASERDSEKFLAELGWREFSYQLLHQFPDLAAKNFNPRFDRFPWRRDNAMLFRWQRGRTGYPIVDAGMRELWHTGYMHNRVRMIVASFLVKHLLFDWRTGEAWFWDTLVDADPANNPASWQWVAGSGADAAPYFRIFNPTLQAEKFDPDGDYVRRWVPELAHLKAPIIHKPRRADAPDYPEPIVEHAEARARALAAFQTVRSGN
jgi:deoxyribodipyrimidine photo-lyase